MTANFVTSTSGSANNGGTVTLTFGSALPGDVVYVAYATTTLKTMAVASSSGGAYATLLSTGNGTGSVLSFGVHRFVQPSPVSLQAICSGTGTATDATAAVGMIFRFASTASPEDATTTSTTGTSSTPDSPSITPVTVDDVIISLYGIFNATAGTAPSSFLNAVSTTATDTRSCGCGMAWTSQGPAAAFNPTAWSSFTSATWCAATVAIKSTIFFRTEVPGTQTEAGLVTEARRIIVRSY